jgi:DNA polymerase V
MFTPARHETSPELRSFPSPCLPDTDEVDIFRPAKKKEKLKGDGTCLAFGSLNFTKLDLPYFAYAVSAGYPSWVDDPFKRHLDLSCYLIRHPKTTYYFKVDGYSMVNAGINPKDLLVVDTALQPKHKDIIIAVINGEFSVKRFCLEGAEIKLLSENPDYPAVTVTKEMNFFVHGVVTTVIRTFNPLP